MRYKSSVLLLALSAGLNFDNSVDFKRNDESLHILKNDFEQSLVYIDDCSAIIFKTVL